MNHSEKKYRVDSFAEIVKLLKEKGATKQKEVISTHYYGEHAGNNVEKYVEYPNEHRFEIHVLSEENGRYTMKQHFQVSGKVEGIEWLIAQGFQKANIVDMEYTEYSYNGGIVGLYTIDTHVLSVILEYPTDQHEMIEKELGLEKAEIIVLPYNKYLKQLGILRTVDLKN